MRTLFIPIILGRVLLTDVVKKQFMYCRQLMIINHSYFYLHFNYVFYQIWIRECSTYRCLNPPPPQPPNHLFKKKQRSKKIIDHISNNQVLVYIHQDFLRSILYKWRKWGNGVDISELFLQNCGNEIQTDLIFNRGKLSVLSNTITLCMFYLLKQSPSVQVYSNTPIELFLLEHVYKSTVKFGSRVIR